MHVLSDALLLEGVLVWVTRVSNRCDLVSLVFLHAFFPNHIFVCLMVDHCVI